MCIGHQSMAVARSCCDAHDCNQGRNCPNHTPSAAAWQLAGGLVVALVVVLTLASGVLA